MRARSCNLAGQRESMRCKKVGTEIHGCLRGLGKSEHVAILVDSKVGVGSLDSDATNRSNWEPLWIEDQKTMPRTYKSPHLGCRPELVGANN